MLHHVINCRIGLIDCALSFARKHATRYVISSSAKSPQLSVSSSAPESNVVDVFVFSDGDCAGICWLCELSVVEGTVSQYVL